MAPLELELEEDALDEPLLVVEVDVDELLAPESPASPASLAPASSPDADVLLVEDVTPDELPLLEAGDVLPDDALPVELVPVFDVDFLLDVAPPLPPWALVVLLPPPAPPLYTGSAPSIPANLCAS